MNKILENRNSQLYLATAIIILNLVIPFIVYPLFEINLTDIYENSFSDLDASIILKTIKSLFYFYLWTDRFFLFIIRLLAISSVCLLSMYLLDIEIKLKYREILIYVLAAELLLLVGDYLILFYNYLQIIFKLGTLKIYESPLSLIYYFPQISTKASLYSLLNSINIFSFLYLFSFIYLVRQKVKANRYQAVGIFIFLFLLFALIKVFDPVNNLFFRENKMGAL